MNTRLRPLSSGFGSLLTKGVSGGSAPARRLSGGTQTGTESAPATVQKFLTFCLGSIEFGIEINRVREIVAASPVTPYPGRPPFVCGLVDLRGHVITLIDMHSRLGLSEHLDSEEECFIILKGTQQLVGLKVDRVSDVVGIPRHTIEPPPQYQNLGVCRFLTGISRNDQRLRLLLDVERLTAADDAGFPLVESPLPSALSYQ